MAQLFAHSRGPALGGLDGEQGEHRRGHIVVVELLFLPLANHHLHIFFLGIAWSEKMSFLYQNFLHLEDLCESVCPSRTSNKETLKMLILQEKCFDN